MRVRIKSLLIAVLLVGLLAEAALGFDHSHRLFDEVLKQSVVLDGPKSRVRYEWIKNNPDGLDQYIDDIQGVSSTEYQRWSREQQLAFLINAYNAMTIKLILSKYPDLKSIKDLGGFFSGPWKVQFFTLFSEKQHLDYIEHSVLRKKFNEPRIHFALVCASIGCPALRDEAFVAESLEQQLHDAKTNFLRDRDRNRIDEKENTLYLSSIFKWFSEDFEKSKGSVEAFVAPWMAEDKKLQQRIRDKKFDKDYLDYDWNLNRAE